MLHLTPCRQNLLIQVVLKIVLKCKISTVLCQCTNKELHNVRVFINFLFSAAKKPGNVSCYSFKCLQQ